MIDRRRLLGVVATTAALAALPRRAAAAEPAPNAPAPLFATTDTQGRPVELAALQGRVVVLEWTNHRCPYTDKHYRSGNMQALQRQAAAMEAVWISIISSGPGREGYVEAAEAEAIAADQSATPTHILRDPSGRIGRLYDARTTPQIYVIDATGRIAYMGGVDSIPTMDMVDVATAENYVRAALDALARGEAPAVQSGRPYGCAIRYAA